MSRPSAETGRWTMVAASLLVLIIIALLTLPGASRYLWEEDSVGFALALKQFDLASYEPHPPGYLFYVLLTRALDGWFGDPNATFVALGFAANVLTAWLVLWIATALGGRTVGLVSVLLWPFNNIVWFYGQVSSVYPLEGLCGAAVAASSFKMLRGQRPWAYISAAVLGLAGGLRGFVVILLLPLWGYSLFSSTRRWRDRLGAVAVLTVAYGSWFGPTLWLAGGYDAYADASRRLFLYNLRRTSVLWTAEPSTALFNLGLYGLFGLAGLGLLGLLVPATALLWPPVRTWFRSQPWERPLVWFFGLWIGVPSLFFVLFHLPKPGYLMVFLPAWSILIAWASVGLILALFPMNARHQRTALSTLLVAHILVATGLHVKVTRSLVVRPTEHNMDRLLSSVRDGPCSEPQGCLLVAYGLPWRTLAYYLPEVPMAVLADEASTWYPGYGAEVAFAHGREVRYASGAIVWSAWPRPSTQDVIMPAEANTVLWYVDTRSAFFKALRERVPLEGPLFSQELGPGALFATAREDLGLPLRLGVFDLEGAAPRQSKIP